MTARLHSEPLPECPGCDRPTRRATYDSNGGLCSDCRADVEYGRARALRHLAARRRAS